MTGATVAPLLGLLIGISLGALGGAGSILAVPALVYVAGESPREATTTSLVVVGVAALSGMLGHWRGGRVRFGAGGVFAALGTGGSLVGSHLNRAVDPNVLLLAFSALMLVASWRMAAGRGTPAQARPRCGTHASSWRVPSADCLVPLVGAGTVVGFLTGFFGVGGGFIVVPALVLALGFSFPDAVGTSLLVIAVNAAVALIPRLTSTGIDWGVTVPFAGAAVVGVVAGVTLAGRIEVTRLVRTFALVLVVVAVYTAGRSALAL